MPEEDKTEQQKQKQNEEAAAAQRTRDGEAVANSPGPQGQTFKSDAPGPWDPQTDEKRMAGQEGRVEDAQVDQGRAVPGNLSREQRVVQQETKQHEEAAKRDQDQAIRAGQTRDPADVPRDIPTSPTTARDNPDQAASDIRKHNARQEELMRQQTLSSTKEPPAEATRRDLAV